MAKTPTYLAEVKETDPSTPQEPATIRSNKQPGSNGTRISPRKLTKNGGWKRARQACTSCRTRKVRCTVSREWPCSNCRWDFAPGVHIVRRCSGRSHSTAFPSRQREPFEDGKWGRKVGIPASDLDRIRWTLHCFSGTGSRCRKSRLMLDERLYLAP